MGHWGTKRKSKEVTLGEAACKIIPQDSKVLFTFKKIITIYLFPRAPPSSVENRAKGC